MLGNPQPGVARRRAGTFLLCTMLALGGYVAWAGRPAAAAAPSPARPASPAPPAPAAAGAAAASPAAPVPVARETVRSGAEVAAASTPPPRYPAEAAAAHQSGRVVLRLLVAVDGSVKDLIVEDSEPAGVFDAATVAAARQWKFSPRLQDGKPVEGWVRVPVTFEAPPPDAPESGRTGATPAPLAAAVAEDWRRGYEWIRLDIRDGAVRDASCERIWIGDSDQDRFAYCGLARTAPRPSS